MSTCLCDYYHLLPGFVSLLFEFYRLGLVLHLALGRDHRRAQHILQQRRRTLLSQSLVV